MNTGHCADSEDAWLREAYSRLQQYLDSECPECEMEKIRQHLANCPKCETEWLRAKALKEAVARAHAAETAPRALRERIVLSYREIRIERYREE